MVVSKETVVVLVAISTPRRFLCWQHPYPASPPPNRCWPPPSSSIPANSMISSYVECFRVYVPKPEGSGREVERRSRTWEGEMMPLGGGKMDISHVNFGQKKAPEYEKSSKYWLFLQIVIFFCFSRLYCCPQMPKIRVCRLLSDGLLPH